MPNFTSFAVAGGSGLVGQSVVAGLVAAGAKVAVLSRSADTKVEGATTKEVDFTSAESVQAALAGVEVVVSTLGGGALGQQPVLAKAAKAAGVQLFLPSEFGIASSHFGPESPLHGKRAFAESLKELGLPALLVATGAFPDTTFAPNTFGLHYPDGTAHVIGSPDTQMSFTVVKDIGSFLGPLLTATPPDQLVSLGEIVIEGSHATTAETIASFEKSHPGKRVEVTTTSIEQAEEELKHKEGYEFILAYLLVLWAKGAADVTEGGKVKTANHLVPSWKPQSVESYLAEL